MQPCVVKSIKECKQLNLLFHSFFYDLYPIRALVFLHSFYIFSVLIYTCDVPFLSPLMSLKACLSGGDEPSLLVFGVFSAGTCRAGGPCLPPPNVISPTLEQLSSKVAAFMLPSDYMQLFSKTEKKI